MIKVRSTFSSHPVDVRYSIAWTGLNPAARRFGIGFLMVFSACQLAAHAQAETLALQRVIDEALAEDPGLRALAGAGAAESELAIADASFPDPVVNVAAANFPVDTFNFDQEPMTQFRVALRQELPRGDARLLKRDRRQVRASQFEVRARDRRSTIVRSVSVAWVDAFRDTRVSALLKQSRPLFAELVRLAESSYAVGDSSQQDVIRAELELLRLRDRELRVEEQLQHSRTLLSRWIGEVASVPLPAERADIEPPRLTEPEWEVRLREHPAVALLALAVDAQSIEVTLAEQDYRPRFGMEVAYGARGGEDLQGKSRPDFLSVGLTFDLPLFTGARQDRRVSAARHLQGAAKDQRLDRLAQLKRELADAQLQLELLSTRLALFEAEIVPASEQAAQAAFAGYRVRSNDFSEVMRAYIAELDARIDLEGMRAGIARAAVDLRYLAGLEE